MSGTESTVDEAGALGSRPVEAVAGLMVLGLCATSVGALLADLYGIAEMADFGRFVTLPSLFVLALVGAAPQRWLGEVPWRIRVGALGGLLGTLGYDVVRIPFALAGQRIFAPIDSYGLFLDGGPMSSAWTDLLGWGFHVSNGVTFGVAFVVVAARRHWGWGVAWGLVLETAAYASPFTERYGLTGKYLTIAIAYGAHVAYGWPLGLVSQRFDRARAALSAGPWRWPAGTALAVTAVGLVLWHQPWSVPEPVQAARSAHQETAIPTAVVVRDRFQPEWLRVAPGECIQLISRSGESFETDAGDLPAGETARWCFEETGVHRLKLGNRAYSGGFVYVEDH